MQRFKEKKHSIDLLFTISLFCVFAISALSVTMAGAGLYRKTVQQADEDYTAFTTLSYIEQKTRSYDEAGSISVLHDQGADVLCLHETVESDLYTTYIYTMDGKLMELFAKDQGSMPDLQEGTVLMDAGSLTMTEDFREDSGRRLLHLTLESGAHAPHTLTLHLKAKEA